MSPAEKRAAKKIDEQINRAYVTKCSGVQIDIMDISKVFDVGRKALSEGRDLDTAIVEFVQTIRKN